MSDANKQIGSNQNGITTQPLPASHKLYVQSPKFSDVRVAMRAVHLSSSGNGHAEQWTRRSQQCAGYDLRYFRSLHRCQRKHGNQKRSSPAEIGLD